jgi:signal transduction histidine kinase
MDSKNGIEDQLKEAAYLTSASWAVLAERVGGNWLLRAVHRLNKTSQVTLSSMLDTPSVDTWLCGALSGGHSRSSALPLESGLNAKRLFVYPLAGSSSALLVGSSNQAPEAQRIWRLTTSLLAGNSVPTPKPFLPDLQTGLASDLPLALDSILGAFVRSANPQGAWIAIRRGEFFDIQAEWNDPKGKGLSLAIDSNPILRRIKRTNSEASVTRGHSGWDAIPHPALKVGTSVWICLPLVIGQRLIGAVALWRQKDIGSEDLKELRDLAAWAAPSVEVIVTFSEMAGHLRRLAMLNDFVLTVSSAQNLDQIARRVFGLLARAFGTELIALYLLTTDRRLLREFRSREGRVVSKIVSVEGHPHRSFLSDDHPQRIDDIPGSGYVPLYHEAGSVLIVPLKYRGQTIGLFCIENVRQAAFTQVDEHLLVVVASHLAGLIEYGRIREEAEGRARSLGLIHEVVQQVIGLTDKAQVVQITADLLAQYFKYELAAILLIDNESRPSIQGLGGTNADSVKHELAKVEMSVSSGITGHVFSSGESMLVNNTSQNAYYTTIMGWDQGSEICVALKEGERVLGVIDVESANPNAFTQNDLVAIESLAGILASVISSADQYERLQDTVRQLRSTQIELNTRMQALQAAENRLVQAAKLAAVGEMAAGIAHELNNPLTTVTGFSELILEEMPEDVVNRAELELVLREARRASDVVRRLLDFSRQGERTRTNEDMNEIIEDVIALTRHLIRTNGVTLKLNLPKDQPWVSVDRNQMKQVVLNLIHNALQAMPGGGELDICSDVIGREGRSWVVVTIKDTGVGISLADKERIFEPFFTTKSDQGGTGLGLSVTYGIVTDHGGKIEVESNPGEGSTFTVWLPI